MPFTPMQLAESFIRTGELADALDALNEHLGNEPGDIEALRLRAATLMHLGETEQLRQALADLDAIPEPDIEDLQQRSLIAERLRDRPAAIAAARAALDKSPGDERIAERLVHLLAAAGDLDAAIELVRQQPRTWRWLRWEGDLLALSGDDMLATARYGLALAQLDEVAGIDDAYRRTLRGPILLTRAHAYRRLGLAEPARVHYEAAREVLPGDVDAIAFNIGLLDALKGDLQSAIAQCRPAWKSAAPKVRAGMRAILDTDPAFTELKHALEAEDQEL